MTTALEIDETLLDAFIGDGSITDVLYVVRSGKEATVYCCRGAASAGGGLVAAKFSQRRGLSKRPRRRFQPPRQTRIGEKNPAWPRCSIWKLDQRRISDHADALRRGRRRARGIRAFQRRDPDGIFRRRAQRCTDAVSRRA